MQSEAIIIHPCNLFKHPILKYSHSPTSTVGIIYISPGRLFPPFPLLLSSPSLLHLLPPPPELIYLRDLYLSTTNKLGYHAPPLPYPSSSLYPLPDSFSFLFPPPHPPLAQSPPLKPRRLTYEMPNHSEGWCVCVFRQCLCTDALILYM